MNSNYKNQVKLPRAMKTEDAISNEYKTAKIKPDIFYTRDFLNNNSSLKDKRCTVTNKIAEWMIKDKPLDGIKEIKMSQGKPYLVGHSGVSTTGNTESTREEELTAMELFKKKDYINSDIDAVIDYQTPICRDSDVKGIGKIDLISVSHTKKEIYLMELKRSSSDETLLRCVCEIYTYYKQIDVETLTKEIADKRNISDYTVVPAVLVFEGKRQHLQYESDLYSQVRTLMKQLKVKMFVINSEYIITEV